MNTIYKSMKVQREIKKRILNDGGGIYILQPQKINENKFLFIVKDTGIGFFISNWDEFIKLETGCDLMGEYMAKVELTYVEPTAIKQGEDSPFLGEAIILELHVSSNKKQN
jgi:hypothetical protein